MEKYISDKEVDFLNQQAGKYYAGSGLDQDAFDSLEKADIEYSMIDDNGEEMLLKLNNKLIGFRYTSPIAEWGEGGVGFFSAEYYISSEDQTIEDFTDYENDETEADSELFDDEGYYESSILNCQTPDQLKEHLTKGK